MYRAVECSKRQTGQRSDKGVRVKKIISGKKEGIAQHPSQRCTSYEEEDRSLMGTGRANGGAGALNFGGERPTGLWKRVRSGIERAAARRVR